MLGQQFVLIVFFSICNIYLFPVLFLERDLPFDCSSSCSLLFYYLIRARLNNITEAWFILTLLHILVKIHPHSKVNSSYLSVHTDGDF